MVFDRSKVIAGSIQGVGFGTQGESEIFLAAKFAGDQDGGFGQTKGRVSICTKCVSNSVRKLFDDIRANQGAIVREKFAASRVRLERPELANQVFHGDSASRGGHRA
jgi:hypothetical protein